MTRSRFAPSPTGFLHIGGARTALFAYLYAKHFKGDFILRIEDTDQARSTKVAEDAIVEGMNWLGLTPDEGPFYQMQRMSRYQEVMAQLLEEGKAYKCYCTKERLGELREAQMAGKEKPRYDGRCRDAEQSSGGPFVVRFKNPQGGSVSWGDQVYGTITVENKELDDLVIMRSDGTPTYNFTVVVDDADMKITEVIRGDDHLNNTPRQINLFLALGLTPPMYAHVPMILNEEGKKLSKRDGAANLLDYRAAGFLPEALLNYLVRLGWSHGDQEVFSIQEMVQFFDGSHISKSASRLSEEKLLWINQQHMRDAAPERLADLLQAQFAALGLRTGQGPALVDVVKAQVERVKTLKEMAERSVYFYQDFDAYDEKAAKKNLKPASLAVLQALLAGFDNVSEWTAESAHSVILQVSELLGLKLGKVAQPLRVAVTGGAVSPPLDVTLALIGPDRVRVRMKRAIMFIESLPAE